MEDSGGVFHDFDARSTEGEKNMEVVVPHSYNSSSGVLRTDDAASIDERRRKFLPSSRDGKLVAPEVFSLSLSRPRVHREIRAGDRLCPVYAGGEMEGDLPLPPPSVARFCLCPGTVIPPLAAASDSHCCMRRERPTTQILVY